MGTSKYEKNSNFTSLLDIFLILLQQWKSKLGIVNLFCELYNDYISAHYRYYYKTIFHIDLQEILFAVYWLYNADVNKDSLFKFKRYLNGILIMLCKCISCGYYDLN